MIRITGGELRGRSLDTPAGLQTRPTQAKLRQALFNSIQFELPEAKVLDLFAGSGALGFEAISRGAAQVYFVENGKAALRTLKKNMETLKVADRSVILPVSVKEAAQSLIASAPFDVILADPPYQEGWELWLLENLPWAQLLRPEGVFDLEWSRVKSKNEELPEQTAFLVKVREKNYGDSVLTTYRREDS